MFGNLNGETSEKSVNQLAIEYLEQKYGEKFEYSAPVGASYTGTRSFLVTCESFGEKSVLVQIENFMDSENRIIKDDYLVVKYEDNVRELLGKMADKEFGESKIFYNSSGRTIDPTLPADASFEEYLCCKDGLISAVIALPENGYKNAEQLKSLCSNILNTFSCDEISVLLIVVDNEKFKTADEDELRKIFVAESGVTQAELNRYNGKENINIL